MTAPLPVYCTTVGDPVGILDVLFFDQLPEKTSTCILPVECDHRPGFPSLFAAHNKHVLRSQPFIPIQHADIF